jgi:MFS transporter, SP family, sugar:H+ symporter
VFAGCCAALFFIVFFFVVESKDRTLEEINQMYIDRVNPIKTKPASEKSSQELRSRTLASPDNL